MTNVANDANWAVTIDRSKQSSAKSPCEAEQIVYDITARGINVNCVPIEL